MNQHDEPAQQPLQVVYTVPHENTPAVGKRSRLACGLVAIIMSVLGLLMCGLGLNLGIHNFMLGKTGKGVAQLLITILNWGGFILSGLLMMAYIGWLTIWIQYAVTLGMFVWGLIDGIIILSNKNYKDADGNLLAD
jgi:TM2 domain-containing membrane protein YozV